MDGKVFRFRRVPQDDPYVDECEPWGDISSFPQFHVEIFPEGEVPTGGSLGQAEIVYAKTPDGWFPVDVAGQPYIVFKAMQIINPYLQTIEYILNGKDEFFAVVVDGVRLKCIEKRRKKRRKKKKEKGGEER